MSRFTPVALSIGFGLSLLAHQALAGFDSNSGVNVPDGICDLSGAERSAYLCDVTDSGTVIEAVTGSTGAFPQIRTGRSHFIYKVTDDGRGASPSHLDFELPICGQPDLEDLLNKDLSGPGGVEVLDVEESTGINYPDAKVLKLDAGVPEGRSRTYTVVYNSSPISAQPIAYAFKTGDGIEYGEMGILGAGCGIADQKTTKRCKEQTRIGEGDDATYRSRFVSRITNKGNLTLFEPMIKENNTNLKCVIASVKGLAVEPALPIPSNRFVAVPTNEKFDGVLDPIDPTSDKKSGEAVWFEIVCEHDEPNLVNRLKSRAETESGIRVVRKTRSNMKKQCPLAEERFVDIKKTCDGVRPGERLMAMNGYLVVEICPRIRVKNVGNETLENVTVTDEQVEELESGYDIGTLEPGEAVNLKDLGIDTCYLPSRPNEPAVRTNGTSDPSDDKYDPETATFTNSARVVATRPDDDDSETSDADSATCSLADKGTPDLN